MSILCSPFNVIDPIMPEFSPSNGFSSSRSREGGASSDRIRGNNANAPIELSAVLAETAGSLYDLLTLRPGDILDTGHPQDQPITLSIQGRRKFRGTPYPQKNSQVVQLLDRVRTPDPDA